MLMECGVQDKTRTQIKWAAIVWTDWATSSTIEIKNSYLTKHCLVVRLKISVVSFISFWLCRFVLEIYQCESDLQYPPASLQ